MAEMDPSEGILTYNDRLLECYPFRLKITLVGKG